MSEAPQAVQTAQETVQQTQAATSTQAAAGGAPNASQEMNAQTTFNSMGELREKYPALYKQMMQGIAMNICQQMQRAQARLKEAMRNSYHS